MTRRYIIGFAIGLLIFLAISLLSAHLNSDCGLLAVFERDACADDVARAGWPFAFYERGGFDYRFVFNLPVLLLDLAIGLISASILGWFIDRRGR
jgi:hypothetical protein